MSLERQEIWGTHITDIFREPSLPYQIEEPHQEQKENSIQWLKLLVMFLPFLVVFGYLCFVSGFSVTIVGPVLLGLYINTVVAFKGTFGLN
jgi:hypothetical protein